MRPCRPLRSIVTVCQLALLAALGTGLPSHHHADAVAADHETRVVSADHHAHVTQLVEQDQRMPSGGMQVAVPVSMTLEPSPARYILGDRVPDPPPRPQDRAPPPGAPRAPPART